jgi:hypothetical protein
MEDTLKRIWTSDIRFERFFEEIETAGGQRTRPFCSK